MVALMVLCVAIGFTGGVVFTTWADAENFKMYLEEEKDHDHSSQ